jgi:hypothetical protein
MARTRRPRKVYTFARPPTSQDIFSISDETGATEISPRRSARQALSRYSEQDQAIREAAKLAKTLAAIATYIKQAYRLMIIPTGVDTAVLQAELNRLKAQKRDIYDKLPADVVERHGGLVAMTLSNIVPTNTAVKIEVPQDIAENYRSVRLALVHAAGEPISGVADSELAVSSAAGLLSLLPPDIGEGSGISGRAIVVGRDLDSTSSKSVAISLKEIADALTQTETRTPLKIPRTATKQNTININALASEFLDGWQLSKADEPMNFKDKRGPRIPRSVDEMVQEIIIRMNELGISTKKLAQTSGKAARFTYRKWFTLEEVNAVRESSAPPAVLREFKPSSTLLNIRSERIKIEKALKEKKKAKIPPITTIHKFQAEGGPGGRVVQQPTALVLTKLPTVQKRGAVSETQWDLEVMFAAGRLSERRSIELRKDIQKSRGGRGDRLMTRAHRDTKGVLRYVIMFVSPSKAYKAKDALIAFQNEQERLYGRGRAAAAAVVKPKLLSAVPGLMTAEDFEKWKAEQAEIKKQNKEKRLAARSEKAKALKEDLKKLDDLRKKNATYQTFYKKAAFFDDYEEMFEEAFNVDELEALSAGGFEQALSENFDPSTVCREAFAIYRQIEPRRGKLYNAVKLIFEGGSERAKERSSSRGDLGRLVAPEGQGIAIPGVTGPTLRLRDEANNPTISIREAMILSVFLSCAPGGVVKSLSGPYDLQKFVSTFSSAVGNIADVINKYATVEHTMFRRYKNKLEKVGITTTLEEEKASNSKTLGEYMDLLMNAGIPEAEASKLTVDAYNNLNERISRYQVAKTDALKNKLSKEEISTIETLINESGYKSPELIDKQIELQKSNINSFVPKDQEDLERLRELQTNLQKLVIKRDLIIKALSLGFSPEEIKQFKIPRSLRAKDRINSALGRLLKYNDERKDLENILTTSNQLPPGWIPPLSDAEFKLLKEKGLDGLEKLAKTDPSKAELVSRIKTLFSSLPVGATEDRPSLDSLNAFKAESSDKDEEKAYRDLRNRLHLTEEDISALQSDKPSEVVLIKAKNLKINVDSLKAPKQTPEEFMDSLHEKVQQQLNASALTDLSDVDEEAPTKTLDSMSDAEFIAAQNALLSDVLSDATGSEVEIIDTISSIKSADGPVPSNVGVPFETEDVAEPEKPSRNRTERQQIKRARNRIIQAALTKLLSDLGIERKFTPKRSVFALKSEE